MLLIVSGLIICLGIVSLGWWRYYYQLNQLKQQLTFTLEHDSNLQVSAQISSPSWQKLIEQVNQLLEAERQEKLLSKKQKQQLKEVLTGLAHDIRTPLTSIDGYVQLLLNTNEQEKRVQYGQIISERLLVLTEMLESAFIYTKLQNEAYELQLETVNLTEVLYTTMFNLYEAFKMKQLEPVLVVPEEPIFIVGNYAALQRVLFNLLHNSLKHGQKKIVISLEKTEQTAILNIENGIAEGQKIEEQKLFTQFYTSDTHSKSASSGLGLFIAQKLVLQMNGQLSAELVNQTFRLSLVLPLNK